MQVGGLPPLGSDGTHHVGATVADLDRSLAFWEPFLGRPPRFRGVLDRPYLGQVVGFPGVKIDAALLELPGGVLLELLDYRLPDRVPHSEDTRHPGNVHLCIRTEDAVATWERAVACGARPVNPNGPVELDGGPNKGARVAYLRDPDGISLELFQLPPRLRERRYERLDAATFEQLQNEAPVAFVPIGTLEYHGPHLPFGVDGVTAHELALRTAQTTGGIVLPATYLATGCLDLPGTLTFSNELVERWARETIAQLHGRGFRAVVLLSGHGPLDLLHLLKRVCEEERAAREGLSAYALHWLELNAARLEGPEEGEPTLVDHAAAVETSWMLALRQEDVRLERLPDDPAARPLGVYGPNPRFTADLGRGAAQVAAAAELLAERVQAMLQGQTVDQAADLSSFVDHGWPEPLRLAGRAGGKGEAALLVTNPGRASRYVSGVLRLVVGDVEVPRSAIVLRNESAGETGEPVPADALGHESGFYLRREQTATLQLGVPVDPGTARVQLAVELGGVRVREFDEDVTFV